ncbi:MAG TPA: hypothetical protein DCX07_05510 [Phycisphaerales bacterium]|nr:hypothetical protein [Phycisphaerales bacterium]
MNHRHPEKRPTGFSSSNVAKRTYNQAMNEKIGSSVDVISRESVRQVKQSHGYAARGDRSLAQWQCDLRAELTALLAIPGRPCPPPAVEFDEEVACDGYTRRRGVMRAADGLAVPFFLLLPVPAPKSLPVCLAIHGHGPGKILPAGLPANEKDRKSIAEGERDYGVQAVRNGYLTVVPELRGFGELMLPADLAAKRDNSCLQLSMRGVHLGKPLLGQRISDMMQLIDWALSRPDADGRVVITGNSGGGTVSLFAAAVDERITAAVPSCYYSTFQDSILDIWHCPCNFVPRLQTVAEMSDLAGLITPRPLLIVAGKTDRIFPIDAVRRGFAAASEIYRDAGAADCIELYEGEGGHRYYAARVWNFLREHLARRA